jgi:hypothetical protein
MDAMLEDMIKESPHMASFLTSPHMASPFMDSFDSTSPLFSDYMPTPNIDDLYTSPLFTMDNGMNFDMPLFAPDGRPAPMTPSLVVDNSPLLADISSPHLTTPLGAVGTYDSAAIVSEPSLFDHNTSLLPPTPSSRSTKPLPSRRTPNGTRRNITPSALISDDAPTQTRKYTGPSATSRKEVPLVFARKRAAQAVIEDDDDDLPDLPPNASEKEQIEWKRRQNTIAARKSRKRKLEHLQYLEGEVERLKRDRDVWRVRAVTLRGVLRGQGQTAGMEEWEVDGE